MPYLSGKDSGYAALLADFTSNAAIGGLVGLLVGDALGVPFEFHSPKSLPTRNQIEIVTPAGFMRSHAAVPPGTWSDDGAQALCLLASLLECRKLLLTDFTDRLLQWFDYGDMAVDGEVFDCGVQTANALALLRDGVPPHESGCRDEFSNGNGSLMRVLPLALWHCGSDEELVEDAHLQSLPTHAHPRSLAACGYYCLVARGYLNRLADPWDWADRRLADIYQDWSNAVERPALLHEMGVLRSYAKTTKPTGTGYVLDSLISTRKAMEEDTFEDVVKAAIMFGHDTDTTAALAGGLAGIRFGLTAIPSRWLEQLRGFDIAEPLIFRFEATMPTQVDHRRSNPRVFSDSNRSASAWAMSRSDRAWSH